jgi:hypothetical protein
MVTAGNIGENFEGGGIAFEGNAAFNYNPGRIFNADTSDYYLHFNLNPGVAILLADYLELSLQPSFSYTRNQSDKDNCSNTLEWGIWTQFTMYVVPNPRMSQGLVFSIGPKLGIGMEHGVDDTVNGTVVEDKSLVLNYDIIKIDLKGYFFIKERFAPYVGITPGLRYRMQLKDQAGNEVDSTSFFDNVSFPINISLGFSIWTPNKDESLARVRFRVSPLEE